MLLSTARQSTLWTPNGLRLNVVTWGEGHVGCLFVHGFADSSHVWRATLSELPSGFYAIAVDLPGHGDSDWDANSRYYFKNLIDDVDFVIRFFNLNSFVLVGHSLGGEIAIQLASRLQNRIAGVVVVDACLRTHRASLIAIKSEFISGQRTYSSPEEYFRYLAKRRPFAHGPTLRNVAEFGVRADGGNFTVKADPKLAMLLDRKLECSNELALRKSWESISAPTLVIRGAWSAVVCSEDGLEMQTALPHSQLETVEKSGHAVMVDNPPSFNRTLLGFLTHLL